MKSMPVLVIATVMSFLSTSAFPATGENKTHPQKIGELKQDRSAMSAALADCIKAAEIGDSDVSISLPTGQKLELQKNAKGEPENLQLHDTYGATVRIEGFVGPGVASRRRASMEVEKDPEYIRLKALARRALLDTIKMKCHFLLGQKGKTNAVSSVAPSPLRQPGHTQGADPRSAPTRENIVIAESEIVGGDGCDYGDDEEEICVGVGGGGGEGGGEGGSGVSGQDSTDRTEADFMDLATDTVEGDFSDAMELYDRNSKKAPIASCSVVIQECKEVCTAVGALEATGCLALGAVAGAVLTPPIGFATGFYCTGLAALATQSCLISCRVPHVVCNP